jgi:hypothetical protein
MTLLAIARADFLERVRRPSYLVTLAFMVWAAHVFLPANGSIYATFRLGDYRGIYNSHWVGMVSAVLANAFISLAGFYVVKNSIERDRSTGVGPVLAGTVLSTRKYLLGKFASNMAVLASMLIVLALAAGMIQWVRAEDRHVNLLAILSPLVLVSLPMLAFVAGAAVLFETVPMLRGSGGNVVFFFVWIWTLSLGGLEKSPLLDLSGLGVAIGQVIERGRALGLPLSTDNMSVGLNFRSHGGWNLTTFEFHGLAWRPDIVLQRLAWAAGSCALPFLAAVWFDRFDISRGPVRARKVRGVVAIAPSSLSTSAATASVASLSAPVFKPGLATLVRSELAIALRGKSRWWWFVMLGLLIAGALVPAGMPRSILHGFAWIWPIFIWSEMGVRERRYRTSDLLFSAPHPVRSQLMAMLVAGFLVAAVTALGIPLRAAVEGQPLAIFAWLAGAAFIPALALACGVWSGSTKLFEVIYLILWYAGPINRVPFVDYGGFTPEGVSHGAPFWTAIAAVGLLALAVIGRSAQVRSDR